MSSECYLISSLPLVFAFQTPGSPLGTWSLSLFQNQDHSMLPLRLSSFTLEISKRTLVAIAKWAIGPGQKIQDF